MTPNKYPKFGIIAISQYTLILLNFVWGFDGVKNRLNNLLFLQRFFISPFEPQLRSYNYKSSPAKIFQTCHIHYHTYSNQPMLLVHVKLL